MAIDQAQLLQMLLQSGGSGPTISPTSGLQDPSLSGLALGPQGMGLGGGESLMGGGPRGFGGGAGEGLGGLDISQLLAQLQAAPGVTGDGLASGIGVGSLGGGSGIGAGGGFGAGGNLGAAPSALSAPTASQQGQAGLGAANTTAQLLGLLKEGTGFGKALLDIFPKGPTVTDLQGLNLVDMPEDIRAALSGVTLLGGPGPTPGGAGAFSLGQLMTPRGPGTFDLSQLMTPAGLPTFGPTLGPGGAPALAGEFGPAGNAVPPVTPGFFDSLTGTFPAIGAGLAGAGGILQAVQSPDARGKGFGAAEAAAAPLIFTNPAIGVPVEIGLKLLDVLTGSLFDSGPSKAWQSFGPRLAGTLGGERTAASNFIQAILGAQAPQDLEGARQAFLSSVEASGVGGFASRGMPAGWAVPELPGATGTAHEGGALWNPNAFNSYLNQLYTGTLLAMQNQTGQPDIMAFQQGLLPNLQRTIQGAGGNV